MSTDDVEKRLSQHRKGVHSNKHLQNSIHKYGIENFSFDILEECNKEICGEREEYWIEFYKSNNPDFGYNLTSGNEYKNGIRLNEEGRLHLSISMTGRKDSEHTKELKRLGRLGKKHTKESREKMSRASSGKKASDDTKHKMSLSHLGKKHTEETKQRLRIVNTGRKMTDEDKKHISESRLKFLESLTDEERLNLLSTTKDCIWVNNGIEAHVIDPSELDLYISLGFTTGMLEREIPSHNKGKVCINNGERNLYVYESDIDNWLLEGWTKGGIKRKKKS